MATISEFDSLPRSFFDWNAPWLLPGSWCHFLLGAVGLILTFTVIFSSMRQTSTASMLLILLLCWADLLFCLSIVVVGGLDLAHQKFSTGKTGCIIYSCLCLFSCYISITAVAAVTLERYFAICHNKNMSHTTAWWTIAGIVVSGIIITTWPAFIGQYDVYALESSLQVCVLAFWSRDKYALIEITICVVTILSGAGIMVLCYGLIFKKFSDSRKSIPVTMINSGVSELNSMQDAKRKDSEKKLLLKCAFYEIATAKPLDPFLDYLCAMSALANSALNPIFLMTFDSRIRSNVIKMAFYEIATGKPLDQFLDYWCAMSALANSALNPMFLIAFDNRIRANVVRMFIRRAESP
ncbi:hypothetical protein EDD86DRAFT_256297 [Gorgonomyces haynaldii]|nr:hypothetical protein EDD86DRAFT_256297 [Gorgonomyces haynaldii]